VTGAFPGEDIEIQTERAILNLKAVLEAGGSSLEKVIKTTVYIDNMDDFGAVNDVYARYFGGTDLPARSCVEVSRLPAAQKSKSRPSREVEYRR
jgi:2-iminobutanoate/2-iminopropanoate deaminase